MSSIGARPLPGATNLLSVRPVDSAFSIRLAIFLLTVGGAGLRFFHLGVKSLWLDETASYALARMPWQKFVHVWWLQEGNMTLYYLLLRGWLHFGQSEAWIRCLSVIFGVASIPLIYLLARRLTSPIGAFAATALLAMNPAHLYYSQEARSYTLALFLVILSTLFLVRGVQDGRDSDWALWSIFSILAVYSHYFAALVLVAQVASLVFLRPGSVRWLRTLLWSCAIFVFCLPGVAFVVMRGPAIPLPWIPRPSFREITHLWMFLGGSGTKYALWLILWVSGMLAFVRSLMRWGRSPATWRIGLVVAWALLPMLITIAASAHHSVFVQKYLLICLPAAIMLAAEGGEYIPSQRIGYTLIALICILSVVTDLRATVKPREDWRGATDAILSSAQSGDAVVFYPFYTRVAWDYYRDRYEGTVPAVHVFAPPFYGDGEDETTLYRELNSAASRPHFQRVWVVLYGPDVTSADFSKLSTSLAARLTQTFGPPATDQFKDIAVLKFGK